MFLNELNFQTLLRGRQSKLCTILNKYVTKISRKVYFIRLLFVLNTTFGYCFVRKRNYVHKSKPKHNEDRPCESFRNWNCMCLFLYTKSSMYSYTRCAQVQFQNQTTPFNNEMNACIVHFAQLKSCGCRIPNQMEPPQKCYTHLENIWIFFPFLSAAHQINSRS